MNGVVQCLDQLGWSDDTTVLAMETAGADSLDKALQAQQLVTLDKITSQARSLGEGREARQCDRKGRRDRGRRGILRL